MFRSARQSINISQEAAAFSLHIGSRTLNDYEKHKTVPPPDVVLGMSRLYEKPEMTQKYCKDYCSIGQAYSYEILNAINDDVPTVLMKLMTEMDEARESLNQLMKLAINKKCRDDFGPEEWLDFVKHLDQFMDVEHNLEVLKISIGSWCDVSEIVSYHNNKCIQKGYIKKEKAAM